MRIVGCLYELPLLFAFITSLEHTVAKGNMTHVASPALFVYLGFCYRLFGCDIVGAQYILNIRSELCPREGAMAEKKTADEDQGGDKSAKGDDQFNVDKQFGEDQQAIRDKEALIDKQALADKQADPSVVLPEFIAPVIGESWSNLDNLGEPGLVEIQSVEIPKQPAEPLNDTESNFDVMVAATLGTGAGGVPIQPGLDPAAAGIGSADDGIGPADDGRIDEPDRESLGDQVMLPGTLPGTYVPMPYFVSPMDPHYVLEPFAITLSGGGAFGAFEVGALDFIYNRYLASEEGTAAGFSRPRPDIVTGTSIGAVNGAWIAQGDGSVEELKNLWFGLHKNDDMFLLNSAFHELLGDYGDAFGPAILDIAGHSILGLPLTLFVPFGFLIHFNIIKNDISNLYNLLYAQSSVYNLGPIRDVLQRRESYWSPTGPGLRGAGISVARDLWGHRILFARGYDDMLYVSWQLEINAISESTQWSPWHRLGGPISSDPIAYHTLRHGVGVIARHSSGHYIAREFDHPNITLGLDSWYQWQTVPAPSSTWNVVEPHGPSQPHVVQRGNEGAAWSFCRDDMGHAYFSANGNGYWGPWTAAGHGVGIANNISGCSHWDGTLDLFARATDNSIRHSFTVGSSTTLGDWVSLEGRATGDVLVVNDDQDYVVDIFWRGTDGNVWTQRKAGITPSLATWSGQRCLSGIITSNLSSGRNSDGTHTIFARGLNDMLYALRQPARSAQWEADAWVLVGAPPDRTLLADPYTLETTEGVEVYVVASDHAIWTILQRPDGTYTPWVSLKGKVWTGIQLRMSTVALETGEDRFVDEAGRFSGTLERIISGDDSDISFSRTNGIIASSSLPGLFPPVRLNDRTWIDGGIRRGVPIGAAIDAGAKRVIAISTAPTKIFPVGTILPRTLSGSPFDGAGALIENYSHANIIDIAMRSLMTMVDAIHWAEIDPETKWPVPVSVIQPTFKIKGGDAIDPGLIRINYAYGWMRAFDRLLVSGDDDRRLAMDSTDMIIDLRLRIWNFEAAFRETYLIATWQVAARHANEEIRRRSNSLVYETPDDQIARWSADSIEALVHQLRGMKRQLTQLLIERRDAGFLLDPETPAHLQGFEGFTRPPHWNDEWTRHSFPYNSVFDNISFIGYNGPAYHISMDAEPPPAI